jgi:hypothetical protein
VANQPRRRSKATGRDSQAQVVPISSAHSDAPDWTSLEGRLLAMMLFVDDLMGAHRLGSRFIAAAAAVVNLIDTEIVQLLILRFAEMTSLKPGSSAYHRAEFRNVLYALQQVACVYNDGVKAPALLPLYEAFSSVGIGPHPDLDLSGKWREGMSEQERDERERRYKSWRSHLRNRVALVNKALNSHSDLSEPQRASILGADPLIALECQQGIARQIRLTGRKARA